MNKYTYKTKNVSIIGVVVMKLIIKYKNMYKKTYLTEFGSLVNREITTL